LTQVLSNAFALSRVFNHEYCIKPVDRLQRNLPYLESKESTIEALE